MAFCCGARSAFKLKEEDYLRSMLARRQLQGFVRWRAQDEESWLGLLTALALNRGILKRINKPCALTFHDNPGLDEFRLRRSV
jgi:hypothetical protein